MKTKKLLCYSYRVIEILLILSITAGLIALGLNSHDKAEMGGLLSPLIVALVWMWFISLPLLIIFVASFIRSIPPSTSYKKTILHHPPPTKKQSFPYISSMLPCGFSSIGFSPSLPHVMRP